MRNYWFNVSSAINIKHKAVKRVVVRKIVMSKKPNIVIEDMDTEGLILCITKEANYSLKNIKIELSKIFKYFEIN